MGSSSTKISWRTVLFVLFAIGAGVVAAIFGQPLIHDNHRAIDVIVTVFSILAGFLVAIITIIGDPVAFGRRSWRAEELRRSAVYQRLVRQKWLFFLYIVTLGVIFADTLINDVDPELSVWLEHVYMGLATTAFIISLSLPVTLINIQLDRHDERIEERRSNRQR